MKRSLRDMMGQTPETPSAAVPNAGVPFDAQDAMNQYSDKSEAELMGELKAARQDGRLDPAALAGVAEQLSPYLNEEQKQRLFSVLQQLS